MINSLKKSLRLTVSDIAVIGIMVATLEGGKLALSFLPNVEIVTLLIILYTLCFGPKVIYAIITFTCIETFLYGFNLWVIMYLYVWPLLAFITYLCRKKTGTLFWSFLSAFFGLFFGAFCAIPYIFTSGPAGAFAWWISGIPFDVLHCISNFVLALVLFHPLHSTLNRLYGKISGGQLYSDN